jgi:hypothetical protein
MPNPIGFKVEKVELESIEEYCVSEARRRHRQNYSDPFLADDFWWAFPPRAVMPVPVIRSSKKVWVWDDNFPVTTPYEVAQIFLYEEAIPWKYKIVYSNKERLTVTCVRTDIYPLFWIFWWLHFRVKESYRLCAEFMIFLLEIWGLAETKPCMRASWRDIKIFNFWNKK